jgi:hypothetical protein
MPVVTIRGQLGSGATEVGKEVADRLHVDYVDRQVIARVAARLHRKEQEVMAKEMPPSSLLGRIVEALEQGSAYGDGLAGAYLPVSQIPLGDASYLQALESVTRELARTDAIVIQGLGSQYILKDHPGALHVITVAPMKVRIDRVMKSSNSAGKPPPSRSRVSTGAAGNSLRGTSAPTWKTPKAMISWSTRSGSMPGPPRPSLSTLCP